jgi:hypothetical protein
VRRRWRGVKQQRRKTFLSPPSLLRTYPGDGGVEVDALKEGVDLDVGLGGGGEGALGTLAGRAETTQGTL